MLQTTPSPPTAKLRRRPAGSEGTYRLLYPPRHIAKSQRPFRCSDIHGPSGILYFWQVGQARRAWQHRAHHACNTFALRSLSQAHGQRQAFKTRPSKSANQTQHVPLPQPCGTPRSHQRPAQVCEGIGAPSTQMYMSAVQVQEKQHP